MEVIYRSIDGKEFKNPADARVHDEQAKDDMLVSFIKCRGSLLQIIEMSKRHLLPRLDREWQEIVKSRKTRHDAWRKKYRQFREKGYCRIAARAHTWMYFKDELGRYKAAIEAYRKDREKLKALNKEIKELRRMGAKEAKNDNAR